MNFTSEEESEEDGFPSYETNHAVGVMDGAETQAPYLLGNREIQSKLGPMGMSALKNWVFEWKE